MFKHLVTANACVHQFIGLDVGKKPHLRFGEMCYPDCIWDTTIGPYELYILSDWLVCEVDVDVIFNNGCGDGTLAKHGLFLKPQDHILEYFGRGRVQRDFEGDDITEDDPSQYAAAYEPGGLCGVCQNQLDDPSKDATDDSKEEQQNRGDGHHG